MDERREERVGDEGKVARRRSEERRRGRGREVESDCVRRRVARGGSGCPRMGGCYRGAGW